MNATVSTDRPVFNEGQHGPVSRVSSTKTAQLLGGYTDGNGAVDTKQIAADLAVAARRDLATANYAYAEISEHLLQHGSQFDVANLERDVQNEFSRMAAGGLWAPNYQGQGSAVLRKNPILEIQWENTRSALSGKSGFSGPLVAALNRAGIEVVPTINQPPAGSLGPNDPGNNGSKNNTNGSLAEDAIADRYRRAGYDVATQVNYDTRTGRATEANRAADAVGDVRRVDVEVHVPGSRPESNTRILVESKVGYTTNSGQVAIEATNDAQLMQSNRLARGAGEMLENFGKVARPVGIALDVYSIGDAYRADGNTIGENTQRTASGIVGSAALGAGGAWAGAAVGAAVGSAVPLVGTAIGAVVGGIIGGISGGIGGDFAGKSLFNWFNS